jgi:hypothetical protein
MINEVLQGLVLLRVANNALLLMLNYYKGLIIKIAF